MSRERLQKINVYGELKHDKRSSSWQKKRYNDSLKNSLKGLSIDPANWENLASDRSAWRCSIHAGAVLFEENVVSKATEKRAKRNTNPALLLRLYRACVPVPIGRVSLVRLNEAGDRKSIFTMLIYRTLSWFCL